MAACARLVFGADHHALWWRMVPLYEETVIARVWRAMAQELFVTSVFNHEARPRQDAKLWKRLEERFALTYQRMSRYHYEIRLRELRVLQLTCEGVGLTETADRLIAEKLHPLDPTGERAATMTDDDRKLLSDSARRVVVRVRKRLRDAGLIPRLPAGRPRKRKA